MGKPARTLHRWTKAEYDRMVETDVFQPEARLELLDARWVWNGVPYTGTKALYPQ